MKLKDNEYLGFTQLSRMDYKHLMKNDTKDKITFGIYVRDEGCISEVSVIWPTNYSPYIRVFPDSVDAVLAAADIVLNKFNNPEKFGFDGCVPPDLFAQWLIEAGFEDCSDKPLSKNKKANAFVCYHENSPELARENGYIQKDEVKLFTKGYDVHKWVFDEIKKGEEAGYICIDDLYAHDEIEYSEGCSFTLCYEGNENSDLYYSLVVIPQEVQI